jgi:hypothetical protein
MPDDRYPDIRERKKRVAQVTTELRDYTVMILPQTDKLDRDEMQYYHKVVACMRQLWDGGPVLGKIGLPEAERRIREEVRPLLTAALQVRTEHDGWVHKLWFMNKDSRSLRPSGLDEIDAHVKEWFGEQTADESLRASCLYGLYEVCEYWTPDTYGLSGLTSLKEACYGAYLHVSLAHLYKAEKHLQWTLEAMWNVQTAREAFDQAVAGAAATPGTSTAATTINELLDAVQSDIDKLVNILEQARSAPAVASEVAEAEDLPDPSNELAVASESVVVEFESEKPDPSIYAIRTYIAKVCADLWTLFELLPRTQLGKYNRQTNVYREWGFKGVVELKDWKEDGFLKLIMSCVIVLFHFNGKRWGPSILVTRDGNDSVLRMLDHPKWGIRRYVQEIQDRNLTSEVSGDIRTKYETWSAYVLSWLDDNRAYIDRLHEEFAENYERNKKENALK